MVSPPVKRQQTAVQPTFSADGERVQFHSAAALGDTPGLRTAIDSYIATRGASGWAVAATAPPAAAAIAAGLDEQSGLIALSPDLSRWLLLGSSQTQAAAGIGQIFSGGLAGSFNALSPVLVPQNDSGSARIVYDTVEAQATGSATDLSTTVFRPKLGSTSYLPNDPTTNSESEPGGDKNNYVAFLNAANEPIIELLARDGSGIVHGGRCGTHLGGGGTGRINQGAISPDGSRIYFSTRPAQPEGEVCNPANPLRIFKRLATPAGPQITELLPGEPETPGDDRYQGASLDGSKVYLTTTRALSGADKDSGASCGSAPGASAGCDLYLYDTAKPVGERLTDVSAGSASDPSPGEGANVLGDPITAISSDGSHAYFVAQSVLTTDPNPEGDVAQQGEPNLYLYERDAVHPNGRTAFVGTLAAADERTLWGSEQSYVGGAYAVPSIGATDEDGGDGHILLFASKAPLTSDDTDAGASDIFRYDAEAETLQRISKAAPGGSEEATSGVGVNSNTIAPNANPAEQGRWVSEDGNTVGFSTAEPLAPGDEDGAVNPYLWKEGELIRLPSKAEVREPGEAKALLPGFNPTLSPSGDEVGFSSSYRLLPQDGDTASDVYVARVGGGFPNPAPASTCNPLSEGACQGPPSGPPTTLAPASESFAGPGNPKPAGKCARPRVRKHGRCVTTKKHKAKKRTGHKKQGGSK
jgi:hypothetical protein